MKYRHLGTAGLSCACMIFFIHFFHLVYIYVCGVSSTVWYSANNVIAVHSYDNCELSGACKEFFRSARVPCFATSFDVDSTRQLAVDSQRRGRGSAQCSCRRSDAFSVTCIYPGPSSPRGVRYLCDRTRYRVQLPPTHGLICRLTFYITRSIAAFVKAACISAWRLNSATAIWAYS